MIDFGPLLANPFLLLFGAAAQFGIFFVIIVAALLGFHIADAAWIGIIAAADGPTSIFFRGKLAGFEVHGRHHRRAYSYMALVPIIQPIAIKAVTTKKERQIHMTYRPTARSPRRRRLRLPDHHLRGCRPHRARLPAARGLPHVRKSAARVRRSRPLVRLGAERAREPRVHPAWPLRLREDGVPRLPAVRHLARHGAGPVSAS